jgi:hypothetical protein
LPVWQLLLLVLVQRLLELLASSLQVFSRQQVWLPVWRRLVLLQPF